MQVLSNSNGATKGLIYKKNWIQGILILSIPSVIWKYYGKISWIRWHFGFPIVDKTYNQISKLLASFELYFFAFLLSRMVANKFFFAIFQKPEIEKGRS